MNVYCSQLGQWVYKEKKPDMISKYQVICRMVLMNVNKWSSFVTTKK